MFCQPLGDPVRESTTNTTRVTYPLQVPEGGVRSTPVQRLLPPYCEALKAIPKGPRVLWKSQHSLWSAMGLKENLKVNFRLQ